MTQLVARCEWTDASTQVSSSPVHRSITTKQQLVLFVQPRTFRAQLWLFKSVKLLDPKKNRALLLQRTPSALQFLCNNGVSDTLHSLVSTVVVYLD